MALLRPDRFIALGYVITTDDSVGQSVAGAGDIDGNGFADLLVGAPSVDGGGFGRNKAGRVRIYFGAAHALLLELMCAADTRFGTAFAAGTVQAGRPIPSAPPER